MPPSKQNLLGLLVEDVEADAALVIRNLGKHGFTADITRVDTRAAVESAVGSDQWDVVICDYSLPMLNALDVLELVQKTDPDLPFVIVSGSIGEETAVDAMRRGAHDYIMKDRMARLAPAVEREIRDARIRRDRRRVQERIRAYAYFDTLTGLPNLVRLQEQLEQAAAQTLADEGPGFALLVLTLSRFREVNESLGYDNGDELLRGVAGRLRDLSGKTGVAARVGGDEFGMLLRDCDIGQARVQGARVVEALEPPFQIAGFSIEVAANLGLAHCPGHADNSRELLQKADVALSTARSIGAHFAVYDPARDPSNPKRLLLLGDLRSAVADGQIVPHLQPKITLSDGAVCGVEALARWRHGEQGDIAPDRFIPLAERSGLIVSLTTCMLENSLDAVCRLPAPARPVPVAVNISPKSLLSFDLVRVIESMMEVDPGLSGLLELEITESGLMEDPRQSLDVLRELSRLGIALYIDDFGTGYSSLTYLQKLPAKAIKIDRSFVAAMTGDPDSAKIVRSTIDLAHGLGLKVVAEGVEDRDTLERLADYHCDEAQGYYIARPMAPDRFALWLAAHSDGAGPAH